MWTKKLFGPPGTGKTTALLEELDGELRRGVPPERIAFMSFTVAARREAKSRVVTRFGFAEERLHHFRTVHSAAFRQMNVPRSSVVTHENIAGFAKSSNVEFSPEAFGRLEADSIVSSMLSGKTDGDKMMAFDHLRRHRVQTLQQAISAQRWTTIRPIVLEHFTKSYSAWKQQEMLYDFTDMLSSVREPLDIDVAFIDEAQDLSKLQWAAVRVLCSQAQRVYIAGDDDQAIFTWAGADPVAFMDHPCDEQVILGKSYRIPAKVHHVASFVVGTIRRRQPKEWSPRDEQGSLQWETGEDHWDPPTTGTVFVLARNRGFLSKYERRLRELGVPYSRSDRRESSISRWARPVVAWEKARKGVNLSDDEMDDVRSAIMPTMRPDKSTPWFEALTRIPENDRLYIRAILRREGNAGLIDLPRVTLSTIHAVKGEEADHVVIDTGLSPACKRELLDGDADSEARVTYVGVTRARQSLTLVGAPHPLIPMKLIRGNG